ncbi:unnamed protein product [Effrenium voratum]|nr:unnamed protein product [Effrenium voratum]|mmetsp:Transcript_65917/g.157462  ORF Transcript_65917/g.157462 Transcript_65917/m.157462 type:complete len:225 (+) Transcript_65917:33-707(+)|eukprot:CAMPEP_0181458952 /NCGR_PEP_ID=MMETSP1110-20121109/32576_1 /TAXON_ID=174948 /ORGANISM="Symbiodinium sp., Strain CCMP421" /LENGTH=224 /DNA_ID=CAMNT_0023583459 /DNA_START=27 /DNA_END=701 /DNA_ORIENTATION=-
MWRHLLGLCAGLAAGSSDGARSTLCCVKDTYQHGVSTFQFQTDAKAALYAAYFTGAYRHGWNSPIPLERRFAARMWIHCLGGMKLTPELCKKPPISSELDVFNESQFINEKEEAFNRLHQFIQSAYFRQEEYVFSAPDCATGYVPAKDSTRCNGELLNFLTLAQYWNRKLQADIELSRAKRRLEGTNAEQMAAVKGHIHELEQVRQNQLNSIIKVLQRPSEYVT